MIKKLILFLIVTSFIGCVSVGKVGYIVPAENDTKEVTNEVLAEACGIVIVDILDAANANLRSRGTTSAKNVSIQFDQGGFSSCLKIQKLK